MRDNKFDPTTELVIAGIDTPAEEELDNPCYDPDSNSEPDDSPGIQAMAAFMTNFGCFSAVATTLIGGRRYVNAGRRRTRALRIANARRAEMGLEPIRIATVHRLFAGDERNAGLLNDAIAENSLRRAERSPMAMARLVARALNFGSDIKTISMSTGATENGVRRWKRLNELAPAVQAAVEAGTVASEAALLLHGKPEPEQVALLEKMLAGAASDAAAAERDKQPGTPAAEAKLERKRSIVAKRRQRASTGEATSNEAASPSKPKRVSKQKAQAALGGAVKRTAKGVRKVLEWSGYTGSEEFKRGALWAIGDLSDDASGAFKKTE
jgi:hypothetical protein